MRVTAAALVLLSALGAQAAPTLHIEPPHWWVGFKDSRLQLMVEAEGVSATRPQVEARSCSA